MTDPKTTPERRKQIEQILVAQHGKNVAQPQIHASPVFDSTGAKVGENIYERQADGVWKNVTPKPSITEDPRAAAIRDDPKMSREEKAKQLKTMGY